MSKKIMLSGFLLLTLIFSPAVQAAELSLKAESAVLIDAHSGKILYEKDPHKKLYPASMTKLMTLVVAMDALRDGKVKMEDIVSASEKAASYGGSQIYLAAGEKLSFYDLILGVALASGNDASVAVAEHIAGSHEGFVELMNKKAEELGLKNTHFVNCNGLHDPDHYSTAYDFAQIGLHALNYPELREISSIKHYRIRENTARPFQYDNKNKLLWWYQGTDGFKTGWTVDAKYCFTGTVERNGLRLVSSVMGVPEQQGHFRDTMTIYNWAYSQYTFKEFNKEDEIIDSVRVGKGVTDQVDVVPEKKVGLTVLKGQDKNLTTRVELDPLADAPIKKGQVLGHISIIQEDAVLSRTALVAKDEVSKGSLFREFKKILKYTVAG